MIKNDSTRTDNNRKISFLEEIRIKDKDKNYTPILNIDGMMTPLLMGDRIKMTCMEDMDDLQDIGYNVKYKKGSEKIFYVTRTLGGEIHLHNFLNGKGFIMNMNEISMLGLYVLKPNHTSPTYIKYIMSYKRQWLYIPFFIMNIILIPYRIFENIISKLKS